MAAPVGCVAYDSIQRVTLVGDIVTLLGAERCTRDAVLPYATINGTQHELCLEHRQLAERLLARMGAMLVTMYPGAI